ncbi:MAG: hypothetical protein AVO33_07445 [delta proteobacterium ML8_F1]|nr:MAG: hypothetical protein AVO33_07445 [delta proteobacterium ML8_F1]
MKRTMSLLLILVLLLGTLPVYGAGYGETLFDLGLVKGDGTGNLNESSPITRAEMMVVLSRMYGVENQAMNFSQPTTFTDVSASDWYAPYVAYAEANEWTYGIGGGKFGPMDPVNEQMAAAFMLRALGYTGAWEGAVEDARALGIDTNASSPILRGQVFELMYDAINTKNTQGVLLGVALGVLSEDAPVEDFKVQSVTADNLIEVTVNFNQTLDEETATDTDNYTLKEGANVIDILLAEVDEPGKTVTLTLNGAVPQQTSASLRIEDVMSRGEDILPDTTKYFTIMDTTVPEATQLEAVGKRTLRVHFSEPMNTLDLVKSNFSVNDGSLLINKVHLGLTDDFVDLELYNPLETGTYTVTADPGIRDYAGFSTQESTLSSYVTKDTTPPTIVDFKEASTTEVTLVWSEDLAPDTISVSPTSPGIYHTNTNYYPSTVTLEGNEMTLTFDSSRGLPDSTVYVYVKAGEVEDLWENENTDQVKRVDLPSDTTAPEVEELKIISATSAELYFTEDVDLDDLELRLYDSSDKNISSKMNFTPSSGDLDMEDPIAITFTEPIEGTFELVIEGVRDKNLPLATEMETTTLSFTMTDQTPPDFGDFEAVIHRAGETDQVLLVRFNEAMATSGSYSISNLSNYIIKSGALTDRGSGYSPSTASFELSQLDSDLTTNVSSGGDTLEIFIPSVSEDSVHGLDLSPSLGTLEVGRLADAAGNTTTQYSYTMNIDAPGEVAITEVKAVGPNTVEVFFDDDFTDFESEDLRFYVDSAATATTGVNYEISTEGSKATYTLEDAMAYDAVDLMYRVVGTDSVNAYGETLSLMGTPSNALVEDAIDPAFILYDLDEDGDEDDPGILLTTLNTFDDEFPGTNATVIALHFTETINAASLSIYSFEVEGGDYEVLAISSSWDSLEKNNVSTYFLVVENPGDDDLDGLTLTQEVPLRDLEGNEMRDQEGIITYTTIM